MILLSKYMYYGLIWFLYKCFPVDSDYFQLVAMSCIEYEILRDFTRPYIESGLVVVAPVKKIEVKCLGFLATIYSTYVGCHCIFFPLCWSSGVDS